jgi:hypothetical protein
MKTYTFKLVITEGNDEFWESLEGKTGCDEVIDAVMDSLCDAGWCPHELTLQKFEDTNERDPSC